MSAINIHGYASPESPYEHNAYLAKNRAKTLTEFVRRQVALPASLFSVSSTPEDWDGLIAFIKGSNLEHKSDILLMASDSTVAPDAREWRIASNTPTSINSCLSRGILPCATPTTILLIR